MKSLPAYLCAALVACLCACGHGALHVDVDRCAFPVKGIDVSAHNGNVDFAKVAADSVAFVMLKATEGTEFCDARFSSNRKMAKASGLKVGAYHFFRFDSPGHLQAYHFMRTVGSDSIDLPLAIDVEDWQNASGVPTAEVVEQLLVMADVLQSAGHRVMIYTNRNGYASYAQPLLEQMPGIDVWISSPSSRPSSEDWVMWQHSHEGAVSGINGPVDLNTFNGSAADFERWLAIPDSIKNTPLKPTIAL